MGAESLLGWVKQAEVETRHRTGRTTAGHDELGLEPGGSGPRAARTHTTLGGEGVRALSPAGDCGVGLRRSRDDVIGSWLGTDTVEASGRERGKHLDGPLPSRSLPVGGTPGSGGSVRLGGRFPAFPWAGRLVSNRCSGPNGCRQASTSTARHCRRRHQCCRGMPGCRCPPHRPPARAGSPVGQSPPPDCWRWRRRHCSTG